MSSHYEVWVPFAGHVSVVVKARSESAAIDAALKAPLLFSVKSEVMSPEIRNLATLRQFQSDNVCQCPGPGYAKAEVI
jgi:hypothetical protein